MTTNDNPAATSSPNDPVEAIVRAAESALTVRRRYQFFVWTQSYLSRLIPHQLVVCGSYDRTSRELVFDVFNSVSLEPALMDALGDARSLLMQHWQACWLEARGKPAVIATADLAFTSLGIVRDALLAAQFQHVLVHGMSRPQRPQEIESFFVFAAQDDGALAPLAGRLELMIPHIHGAWQRVQVVERDVVGASTPQQPTVRVGGVTQREREILSWLREGKSNQQIADELGISALTVKNHVQKILRKLNAANRAQAVAQAMSLQLLERVSTQPAARPRLVP
ncbi:response regulator transcription factor [Roseateles sp. BYS78W]|uniref:Response regulator transcription factor n=1 Tax=Pelomonas candidula TaxID=3299025 RepID=A0ABW7HIX8_9BURK